MKKTLAIILALILALACGMQLAAYAGDVISLRYEVCPESPNGRHCYTETENVIVSEDNCEFFHINNVTVREKCEYCGKLGDEIDFYRESAEHTYVGHFDPETETYIIACTACGRIYP